MPLSARNRYTLVQWIAHRLLPKIVSTGTAVQLVGYERFFSGRGRLPARSAFSGTLKFREGDQPRVEAIHDYLSARGLRLPTGMMTLKFKHRRFEMECVIFGTGAWHSASMTDIALELSSLPAVESFVMTRSSRA
jgi:hypothetical protein